MQYAMPSYYIEDSRTTSEAQYTHTTRPYPLRENKKKDKAIQKRKEQTQKTNRKLSVAIIAALHSKKVPGCFVLFGVVFTKLKKPVSCEFGHICCLFFVRGARQQQSVCHLKPLAVEEETIKREKKEMMTHSRSCGKVLPSGLHRISIPDTSTRIQSSREGKHKLITLRIYSVCIWLRCSILSHFRIPLLGYLVVLYVFSQFYIFTSCTYKYVLYEYSNWHYVIAGCYN